MLSNREAPQVADVQKPGPRETTVVVIKPEEIQTGRASAIYSRIQSYCAENGLELESRSIVLDRQLLDRHYFDKGEENIQRIAVKLAKIMRENDIPFEDPYSAAVRLLRAHVEGYDGKPAIVVRISGPDAIAKMNAIKGNTDSTKAPSETIRGQFSPGIPVQEFLRGEMMPVRNVVHVPESKEEAAFDVETFWERASTLVSLERPG